MIVCLTRPRTRRYVGYNSCLFIAAGFNHAPRSCYFIYSRYIDEILFVLFNISIAITLAVAVGNGRGRALNDRKELQLGTLYVEYISADYLVSIVWKLKRELMVIVAISTTATNTMDLGVYCSSAYHIVWLLDCGVLIGFTYIKISIFSRYKVLLKLINSIIYPELFLEPIWFSSNFSKHDHAQFNLIAQY